MSIGVNQSKEFNHLTTLTLKVKPLKYLKYLPTSLAHLPTYLNTYSIKFGQNSKNVIWHICIMPHVTI
jgi:hypothetical protein